MKRKNILFIVTIVILTIVFIVDILLFVNAFIDGKYIVEPFADADLTERIYMRIWSLSGAMFLNLGIALYLCLHKRKI